jgi:hypothetical protein
MSPANVRLGRALHGSEPGQAAARRASLAQLLVGTHLEKISYY